MAGAGILADTIKKIKTREKKTKETLDPEAPVGAKGILDLPPQKVRQGGESFKDYQLRTQREALLKGKKNGS